MRNTVGLASSKRRVVLEIISQTVLCCDNTSRRSGIFSGVSHIQPGTLQLYSGTCNFHKSTLTSYWLLKLIWLPVPSPPPASACGAQLPVWFCMGSLRNLILYNLKKKYYALPLGQKGSMPRRNSWNYVGTRRSGLTNQNTPCQTCENVKLVKLRFWR